MRKIYCVLWVLLALVTDSWTKTERLPVLRQMSPYKKGDIIRFTDNHGDTITLTAKQETSTWESFDDGTGQFLIEHQTILLQSDSDRYGLDIKLIGWDIEMAPQNRIQFCLNTPFNSTFGSALYEEKNGDFANGYWISPNCKLYTAFDSVVIGNHTYYDVSFFDYAGAEDSITSYYNKTHGVLQMASKGETVFTLQEYIPYR